MKTRMLNLLALKTVKPAATMKVNFEVDGTAPSLRVPVTMANRTYLRDLRRAELEAWRDAPGGTLCGTRARQ